MAETVDSAQAENDGREPVIQISHVWKFFGALPALQDVSLTVMPVTVKEYTLLQPAVLPS